MLSRLKNNERLKQQKYVSVWLMPVTLASVVGLALLADKLDSFTLYVWAQYVGLIGAVAWGIMIPKKRDEFRCSACNKLLGTRVFLERGSEFKAKMRQQYTVCPRCDTTLWPTEMPVETLAEKRL